ncbi:NAD-dependent epimerase/dehydratase family protein [Gelidibacter gilvus]|uniref:NAD-dependent epimerase/dehydratase family protein n=1 Tax=Gelidibacter gilvus TaxID=59602 RepID=A0A4Q0XJN4_9FLAO|nr:NAD-dependent epimerase/dehydratase family protein [Gelidibacter gilvus]RXJ52154.1 NAD-dependent epimerase/dehydratase family protein [Gelidibacter gilvus]
MILVTGGTGLVGSHLLYKLLKNNEKVKAIYRREHKLELVKKVFAYYSADFESLYQKIEWINADITDVPSLQIAFKNVNYVYHCAAFVSFEPDKYHQLRKINIEGTANVVNLCISHQVKKLCYVSSIATIGHHQDPQKLITEDTNWNQDDDNSVYAITKYGAEIEVWRGTQEGLDAVILNPGIIIGPGLWNSGGSSSLIKKIYKGIPYYTTGVTAYVDVDDVVRAMLLLMQSPIKNERFIVISENLSFKEFQHQTALALGVKPASKEATSLILGIGWRLDWLNRLFTGKRRRLSKHMTKSAKSITKYDASKLKNALNFEFKPMQISIEESCKLFLEDLNNDS